MLRVLGMTAHIISIVFLVLNVAIILFPMAIEAPYRWQTIVLSGAVISLNVAFLCRIYWKPYKVTGE